MWIDAMGGNPSLAEITQEMVSINQELNKIHRSSSTGNSNLSMYHSLQISFIHLLKCCIVWFNCLPLVCIGIMSPMSLLWLIGNYVALAYRCSR